VFHRGIASGPALIDGCACMSATADTALEARFSGSSAGGGPQTVALLGGAGEDGRVKIPYLWLEFYPLAIRLRGRRLIGRLVAQRDIHYKQITQLVPLVAATEPRGRGLRLRIEGLSESLYFFTRPTAVPPIVELFTRHGVRLDGRIRRTRIPYSLGYIYPENAPVEPLSELLSEPKSAC
jgi:hypothetical protein